MSKGYVLGTALAALLLALPAVIGIFSDAAERSRIQRRPLAEWPAAELFLRDPRAYFSGAGAFVQDNAAPIIEASQAYRRLLVEVLHSSPSPDIVLGDGPFIFFDMHKNLGGGSVFSSLCPKILDPKAVAALRADVLKLYEFFGVKDRRVLAIIIPTKPSLYGDRLPASVKAEDRELCAQHLTDRNALAALDLDQPGGVLVYPYRELAERRNEPHFYPPEGFHNGEAAARIVALKTFGAVGIAPTNEYVNALKFLDEADSDLATILGYKKRNQEWFFDDYAPFGVEQTFKTPEEIGRLFNSAYDWRTFTAKKPMSERSALVIGDSFAAKNALELAAGYKSLLQININSIQPRELLSLKRYLDGLRFDDVFFIMSDDNAFRLVNYMVQILGS